MEVIFKGQHAINYDDWYTTEIGGFIDQVESNSALALFAPRSGMEVLDAGCGTSGPGSQDLYPAGGGKANG
ncbi:MAG: hypothetical protein GX808_14200 [Syntrophomonadaceae bacterium]|jgi:hypothetical protein|nr:hypothetical protein [Syntrophomonadaceae bacterium]